MIMPPDSKAQAPWARDFGVFAENAADTYFIEVGTLSSIE
jgi:hypothetical protein